MRILIADSTGPGALIGSQLMGAGHFVTFLDSARSVRARMFSPLKVHSELGNFSKHTHNIEDAEILYTFDLIILAVRAHKIPALASILYRAIGPGTLILPLTRGIEHIALLEAACPGTRVLDGLHDIVVLHDVVSGSARHVGGTDQILIGARGPNDIEAAQKIAGLFVATKLDVRIVADAERQHWEQMVRTVGVVGLAGLMQVNLERIGSIDTDATHLWALVQECAAVANASGHRIDIVELAQFMERLPNSVPVTIGAMLDGVAHGDLSEIKELAQQMFRAARFVNVATPVLDLVHTALTARAAQAAINMAIDNGAHRTPVPPVPPRQPTGWFSRRWSRRSTGSH